MINQRIPQIKDEGYQFKFPLRVFSIKKVNLFKNVEKIKEILEGRNIFYSVFDGKRRKLLIKRIISLNYLLEFLLNRIKHEIPRANIVSVYAHGSYLYGDFNYPPDDIDIGAVVKGCAFKYIINGIKIPDFLRQKLIASVGKISLFIYGEENMSKGIPIDDTVIGGVIHKETTLRELSKAYWRSVVIWGRDFRYIKNNERNILTNIARDLNGCYIRLFNYGNGKEDDRTRFRKIANRLIEINLFLKLLYPTLKNNWEYLFKLPLRAFKGELSYAEIKKLCDSTFLLYKKIKEKSSELLKNF